MFGIHLAYILHIFCIYFAYIWYNFGILLAYILRIICIFLAHIWHIFIIYLAYFCHIFGILESVVGLVVYLFYLLYILYFIHLAYVWHIFDIYFSCSCHICVIYLAYIWQYKRQANLLDQAIKKKEDWNFLIDLHGRYFFLLLFSFIFSHSHSAQMFLWHCNALHFTALHCSELQYFISHLIKITKLWDIDLDLAYISLVQDKKNTKCHFE